MSVTPTSSPSPTGANPALPLPTPTPASDPGLAAKLAQMLMIGFRGVTLDADNPIVADVRDRHIGATVLFSYDVVLGSPVRNVQSPAQLQALDADLQHYAGGDLMITVDEEGGRVARLNEQNGFPPTVSPQALGERNDLAYTYAQAETLAKTLAAAGITHNLAPAVDVNINPNNPVIGKLGRSFSGDPAVVTAHARAFIEAHHANRITTTLKHFPGHGSSTADSHLGLVNVTDTWQPIELDPYRTLIQEGLADAVMSAHVFNANLDPDYPATLSKAVLTDLLRGQLGYDGVIITDDMGMGAITTQYGFEEAVVRTVEAGADMLALGDNLIYDPDVAARTISILQAAVESGRISVQRIDESVARIQALKDKWRD